MKEHLSEYPELDLVLQEVRHAFQVQFVKRGTKQKTGKGQSEGRVRD